MSYYIQHIVTIDEDSTREKLQTLAEIIEEQTEFNFKVYDDHLDDSNWNFGMGVSHAPFDTDWERVSEKFGEIAFTVHCFSEEHAIYDFNCFDGTVDETVYRNNDGWYRNHEDFETRSPGAREGYYDDPGYGGDYTVNYGENGHLPAGVQWWMSAEKDD